MTSVSRPVIELTVAQARVLHLAVQGLLHKPRTQPSPEAVMQAIARTQLLQIDTIHVVARSPYLVLYSRLGGYPMVWLDELLASGQLAECWAHEACFVSATDYPLHRAARPLREGHWAARRARQMAAQYPREMDRLLEHVREHGPVRSADFNRRRSAESGWWDWKPEKRWLEAWFALGELMVARRDRFQRVYDLAERVRARHAPGSEPASPADARRCMLARSIQALGIAKAGWIADYFRLAKVVRDELDALCADGEILRVGVRGWDQPAYVHHTHAGLLDHVADGRMRATHTTLLSPFDPVVWDRRRARELFGFEYTLECYLPAPKRRYGYFVLPILHRGRLVGRLDAKAHRGDGVFEVKSIHLESDVELSATLLAALATAISSCARWHDTPCVRIGGTQPRALSTRLHTALRQTRSRAA
ncbi:MAG TPA: crosslink repair DNA glycosylase YcaQ family protein [Oleiagrimonas sp.]|nr:crosslink repair DNA glycosylase YcaQ family protein [Oleiagrimonas sp.]